MKKYIKSLPGKINAMLARLKADAVVAKGKLADERGQFVMDHAVVFVIILVVAAIVIALLTTFLQTDMAPLIKQKILDFFN